MFEHHSNLIVLFCYLKLFSFEAGNHENAEGLRNKFKGNALYQTI